MIKYVLKPFLWLAILLVSLSAMANYPPSPKPFRYVSDYTQTLSPQDLTTLENALADYGRKTSSQIAVVIVPSTQGEEISHYSHTLFNLWGIGRAKQNNGILLLVAKDDRKLFIATGRGLEGALLDAIASSIIRNEITPYFKQNLYAQGIAKGLSAIIAATQGEYAPAVEAEQGTEFDGIEIFIIAAVIIFFLFNVFGRGSGIYISPSQADRIIRTTDSIRRNGGFGRSGFGSGGGYGSGSGSSGGFGGGNTGGGGAGGSW